MSAYFDLTPNAKMNIIGCTVAFSELQVDGSITDISVVLPLSWVAGKDGRVTAQRLRQILCEAGIDPDDVCVAITEGGSDNHGGDKATGHGKHGTIAEAVGSALWMWCTAHMAQLAYKDAMKKIPAGLLTLILTLNLCAMCTHVSNLDQTFL